MEHHQSSTLDSKIDVTDDNCKDGVKMETDNKQTKDDDISGGLPGEITEEPSCYCSRITVRSRTRLQSAKSFPPYSQCIGGVREWDDHHPALRHHDVTKKDRKEGTERKEDFELKARCAREDVKAQWRRRRRRREKLGASCEDDSGRWEGAQWWEKESGRDREHDDRRREGGPRSAEEIERQNNEDEQRKRSRKAPVDGANCKSAETPKDAEPEELMGTGEGPTTHKCFSLHPILSKLLHSSPTSSINLSSPESDGVFSEGEDAGSKRRTFRKCRSWKTFMTMMHWSLRRQSSWVQLAGHQGNFHPSDAGMVLKLYSEVEAKCLDSLMSDLLRPFVPQYHGLVTRGEHCYIRMEDLLSGLKRPVIMDCKMGVRTYQEEELVKAQAKAPLRSDMYQKMVTIDPSALSAKEHAQKGVTKWRYLQWRDKTSSTSTLGFRIEGIMMEDGSVQRDFRKILTLAQATEALLHFTGSQQEILKAYHSRLLALSDALKNSLFFRTHEVIGSSLLFIHDHSSKASVWMIDFGKTSHVSSTKELLHNVPWAEGSREDGYLIGLSSLITALSQAISMASSQQEDSSGGERTVA